MRLPALFLLAIPALAESPERRAIGYLAVEVPRWHRENGCHSCHNNGDAARALIEARRLGYPVDRASLANTLDWIARPRAWDSNRGDPRFSDQRLARIQFAAALADALRAGLLDDRAALREAAAAVAREQRPDGSWALDDTASLGAPATYGPFVATWLARRTLIQAGGHEDAAARAARWLTSAKPEATIDAAAVALAVGASSALEIVRRNQSSGGGWGPYRHAPAEPFDTALALLALQSAAPGDAAIARGRAWLIGSQLEPGGWAETTRPAGGQSYAQHMSTTGWAALALLATAGR
jgi:hypothetical protein